MHVKMIPVDGGFRPASRGEEKMMFSFGIYDTYPIDHTFTLDELKQIGYRTGLAFTQQIPGTT